MDNRKLEKKLNILLIDPNSVTAEATKHFLQQLEYAVTVSRNGNEALQYLHTNTYDLILLDLELPDMPGIDFTKQFRDHEKKLKNPHTVIIAQMNLLDHPLRQKCIVSGIDSVIQKPLTKNKALKIINEYFAKDLDELNEPLINPEEKSINLSLGTATSKMDINSSKKMINMLVSEFKKDLPTLKKAKEKNNWEIIRSLAHKYRGSSAYCGTTRLQKASMYLEDYLKNTQEIDFRDDLYNQFINEMNKLAEEAKYFHDQDYNTNGTHRI